MLVFTNGVFDLFHFGHLVFLEGARQLGTRLVVSVNSDESAR
jgi:cytidyltransferase-like protein